MRSFRPFRSFTHLVAAATSIANTRCTLLRKAAVMLLAGAVAAQSPLTTTYAGGGPGVAGSQIFFDLSVLNVAGITIKSLDVNLSSLVGTAGFITIAPKVGTYAFPPLAPVTPAMWFPPSAGPVTAQGVGNPSHVCLAPPLFLPFGLNSVVVTYTAVAPQFIFNGPPPPPILTAATLDVQLWRGKYQPIPWLPLGLGTDTFMGSIHYEVGTPPICATCANKVAGGVGCASPCPPFPVLALDSNYPVLGEALDLITTGASPCAVFGGNIIGFTLPWGAGGSPLCMPLCACLLYPQPDVMMIGFPVAGTWTQPIPLPANNAFCSAVLYAQSFTVEPPVTVITSNFLTLTVGS